MSLTTYDFELDTVGQPPAHMTVVRGACAVVASGGSRIARLTQTSGYADAILTNVPAVSDIDIAFQALTSSGRHGILLMVNDAITTGYLVQFDDASSDRVEIYKLTALAGPTPPYTTTVLVNGSTPFPTTTDNRFRVTAVYNGSTSTTITVFSWNGSSWTSILSHTDSSSPWTSGKVGVNNLTGAATDFDNIVVTYPDPGGRSIAITNLITNQPFQRAANGFAVVEIEGTYDGDPTALQAKWGSGAWQNIDTTPSGDAFLSTITLPPGTGDLSVRFVNDEDVNATVTGIMVGDIFPVIGQSNADGRGDFAQPYTSSQPAYEWNGSAWVTLADPTGTGTKQGSLWPLVMSFIADDQDVPVAILNWGQGSTNLGTAASPGNWHPAGTGNRYDSFITEWGQCQANAARGIIWYQGESDVDNAISKANYLASLTALATDLRAQIDGYDGNDVKIICTQLAFKTSGGATRANLDAVRSAQQDAWLRGIMSEGPCLYDIGPLVDGVHLESTAELVKAAPRFVYSIKVACYAGTNYVPRAALVSTVDFQTITVTMSGTLDTAISSYDPSAWIVTVNGSPVTITSVTRSGNNVAILLAAVAAGDIAVTFASFNDATGVDAPTSPALSLPDSTTTKLPMHPIYAVPVGWVGVPVDQDLAIVNAQYEEVLARLTSIEASTLAIEGDMEDLVETTASIEAKTVEAYARLVGGTAQITTEYDYRKRHLTLVRKDDYNVTSGTHIDMLVSVPTGVNASTASVSMSLVNSEHNAIRLDTTPSLVLVEGEYYIRFTATSKQMSLRPGPYDWQAVIIEATNNRRKTVIVGTAEIVKDL